MKTFDPRYTNIKHEPHRSNHEHMRIHRMLEKHDKWSMPIFWGFVVFWVFWGLLALVWLYTYVIQPVSQFWN